MNHNKLNSSSAGVATSWDYNLQFYLLEGGSLPSIWGAEQCYAKQWNPQVSATDEHFKKLIGPILSWPKGF